MSSEWKTEQCSPKVLYVTFFFFLIKSFCVEAKLLQRMGLKKRERGSRHEQRNEHLQRGGQSVPSSVQNTRGLSGRRIAPAEGRRAHPSTPSLFDHSNEDSIIFLTEEETEAHMVVVGKPAKRHHKKPIKRGKQKNPCRSDWASPHAELWWGKLRRIPL